jgi:hypothetical protein
MLLVGADAAYQLPDLTLGILQAALSVRESVADVGDRHLGFRSRLDFVEIRPKALCCRLSEPQGMSGLIQGKEELFALHL